MKAIETRYKNRRFRSRLEARYAVLLDALGVPWVYEKEGYELDGLQYLPDFWLPEQDSWLEIKGQEPTGEELEKAARLSFYSNKTVYVRYGDISPESNKCYIFPAIQIEAVHGFNWEERTPIKLPYQLTNALNLLNLQGTTFTYAKVGRQPFLSITSELTCPIQDLASKMLELTSEASIEWLTVVSRSSNIFHQISSDMDLPCFLIEILRSEHTLFVGGRYSRWGACKRCKAVGVHFQSIKHRNIQGEKCNPFDRELQDDERIDAAYAAAMQARFEFGETPN
jgi:hypothetical protein